VELVKKLHEAGRTHREIAAEVGLSKGTVGRILNGTRKNRTTSLKRPTRDPDAPYVRCPTCGGNKVQMPCIACSL
jgi:predicted transcriptional regulator